MIANKVKHNSKNLSGRPGGCLFIVLLVQLALMGHSFGQADGPMGNPSPDPAARVYIQESYGKMPLYFVENRGQLDSRIDYYAKAKDKALFFTPGGLTLVLRGNSEISSSDGTGIRRVSFPSDSGKSGTRGLLKRWVVKLDFVGADPRVKPLGEELTPAVISYFKGSREQWKTGLKTYSSVVYRNLWPGIDLIYSGTVNRLKYRFVVRPGADPGVIRLAYRGTTSLTLNENGQLEVETPVGGFKDDRPYTYQELEGQRVEVKTAYRLDTGPLEEGEVYGFEVGPYDTKKPLILDPAVYMYCGYIGGSDDDQAFDIAVDGSGNAYVTGKTGSWFNFPVKVGPDTSYNGDTYDAFVAKVNASGTGLIYCGYIGGNDADVGNGIAVDGSGNAYVTGLTFSSHSTFPATGGPDLTYNGGRDAFVAKVNASGTSLVYCGYVGGSQDESGEGIAVDGSGNAYITGYTYSNQSTFPETVGPDLTFNGGVRDAFVAKVNTSGSLVYCGYIGGNGSDWGADIAVDGSGNAYVTGETQGGLPVSVGPDTSYNGGLFDVFVAKVNASGLSLHYCGYIGGYDRDTGLGIAVDTAGYAYVTGWTVSQHTGSTPFPVTVGPDLTHEQGADAFVAKVHYSGASLNYCGYIGGGAVSPNVGNDYGHDIAVDDYGNAFVTGLTTSTLNFPTQVGPNTLHFGGDEAFVAKVSASGKGLIYCGYIAGSSDDYGDGIAVDGEGNAYVTGYTWSSQSTFPVTVGPDLTHNGTIDAFVAKVVMTCPNYGVSVVLSAFEDISSTGTDLGLGDESYDYFNMGFTFYFYNDHWTQCVAGANGTIHFGWGPKHYSNVCIPGLDQNEQGHVFIAPFWDDLNPGAGGHVYYQTKGSAPNRRVIVQWDNVPHYNNVGAVTFQAILYEGTNQIKFQYKDVVFGNSSYDYGASATVGVQGDAECGTQYSCNTLSLVNSFAILFRPNAKGEDTIGVRRSGVWYLRNSNSSGAPNISFAFGLPSDTPVVGDWNGDGEDTIGVRRSGVWYLRNSNSSGAPNISFAFGLPSDTPVVGDWNGDGVDTIGVRRSGVWYLRNSNSSGAPNISFAFGLPSDKPVVGDWNGDGIDTIGVRRSGVWYLRNSNSSGAPNMSFAFGLPSDTPVVGDWNGNGIDTIGVRRSGMWYLRNSNSSGAPNMSFAFGLPTDVPLVGDWDGN